MIVSRISYLVQILIKPLCMVFLVLCLGCAAGQVKELRLGQIFWPPMGLETPQELIDVGVGFAIRHSDVLLVQVSWSPGVDLLASTKWMSDLALEHNRSLVIAIDWQEPGRRGVAGGLAWSFCDVNVSREFTHEVMRLITARRPEKLIVGVEVDHLAITDPESFRAFAHAARAISLSIASDSLDSKVGVSFDVLNLSRVARTGNIYDLVSPFARSMQFVGMSIYPDKDESAEFAIERSFNIVDQLVDLWPETIISEASYPVSLDSEKIEQSEVEQELFLRLLVNAAQDYEITLLIWTSVIDTKVAPKPWMSRLGLLRIDGFQRPSANLWIDLRGIP